MIVHLVGAAQKLLKVIVADVDGDRKTDGGPERITAANPVPELEHVLGINTEVRDGLGVGRQRNKVLRDMGNLYKMVGWINILCARINQKKFSRHFVLFTRPTGDFFFLIVTSLADCRNHSLAEVAFVIVSWVVKVLDATMKRVVSGSQTLRVSAM